MKIILLVGLGGAIGSVLRYLVVQAFSIQQMSTKYPIGTLIVNAAGCLLAGILYKFLEGRIVQTPELKHFLLVGFLGGLTTFSAFSLETMLLLKDGLGMRAIAYLASSIIGGLIMVMLGMKLGEMF